MFRKTWRIAALAAIPFLLSAERAPEPFLSYSPQGWNEDQRNRWYSTTQGSRLMPYSWAINLERAEDTVRFLSPENMQRFRMLPGSTAGSLPLGFVQDVQSDRRLEITRLRWLPNQRDREPWVGLNCSACHTTEISGASGRTRIDGAPGRGDFQTFVEQLDFALTATRTDPQKWDRFARAVLSGTRGVDPNNAANRTRLAAAVDQHIAYRRRIGGMNSAPIRYGFSRVDAFGFIFNQASFFSHAQPPTANPPTAPVSYPFLWNITQLDYVQWNNSAPNKSVRIGRGELDVGALGRNAGEVVGVFGEVVTRPSGGFGSEVRPFHSSIQVRNLIDLELLLTRLRPPQWPEQLLGPIDRSLAAAGEPLYRRDCASCHTPLAPNDLTTPITTQMSWLAPDAPAHPYGPNIRPGTDPLMACNAYSYSGRSGNLQGYGSRTNPIGQQALMLDITEQTVVHAIFGKVGQLLRGTLDVYEGGDQHAVRTAAAARPAPPMTWSAASPDPYPGLPPFYRTCVDKRWGDMTTDRILGYKARPLTGIWATAPYLHNGSVPTLYDLLRPPADRPRSFYLGTDRYDGRNVGFETERSADNSWEFRSHDAQGRVIWGNYNGGHYYRSYSEQERRALVEYMKTL
jgi:mono/diheme cytochrome c family protein